MTYRNNFTLPVELLEQIAVEGFDVFPDLIRIIDNPAVSISTLSICFLDAAQLRRLPRRRQGRVRGVGFHLW